MKVLLTVVLPILSLILLIVTLVMQLSEMKFYEMF